MAEQFPGAFSGYNLQVPASYHVLERRADIKSTAHAQRLEGDHGMYVCVGDGVSPVHQGRHQRHGQGNLNPSTQRGRGTIPSPVSVDA